MKNLKRIVIDASVTLAWGIPDEGSDFADSVLQALQGATVVVPALWALEITNGLVVAERRKRIRTAEMQRFVALLDGLNIVQDVRPITHATANVLPLAKDHGLSAYDAAYLELALREAVVLATLDGKLRKAALDAGARVFTA